MTTDMTKSLTKTITKNENDDEKRKTKNENNQLVNSSTRQLVNYKKKTMKNNSLLNQIIQLSQSELESLSFTRQGTIVMKVNKTRKLPEMEVKGADVTIGKGRVVVTKKRTPRPYTGNVSQIVHQSQSSYGKSFMRVTKDNAVHLHIAGTTQSLKNKHDVISALELTAQMLAMDGEEMKTSDVSDGVLLQWTKAKKAHDAQEKREQQAWETKEENDLNKIGYA